MINLEHIKGPNLKDLEKLLKLLQKSVIIQGTPHLVGSTWYIHFLVQDLDGLDSDVKLQIDAINNTTTNTKTTKVALKKDK